MGVRRGQGSHDYAGGFSAYRTASYFTDFGDPKSGRVSGDAKLLSQCWTGGQLMGSGWSWSYRQLVGPKIGI